MSRGKVIPTKYRFQKNDDGSYHMLGGYKGKITGTYFAPIVGKSPWQTPFTAAAHILGLYREDISDLPAVRTGVVLEPVILQHLRGIGVLPAREVFGEPEDYNEYGQHVGEHSKWKSDWDHPIFGGHVDGVTEDGKVVEVKTTSSPEEWLKGVPEHYWLQASLYAHFLGADDIMFAVGFMDQESVSNPWRWKPEGNVSVFDVKLHPRTDEYIAQCTEWYKRYIDRLDTPVPDMNDPRDAYVVRMLDAQLMTQEDMLKLVDAYTDCIEKIEEYDSIEKEKDIIKSQMMLFLAKNDMQYITGTRRAFKRIVSDRTSVDTDRMKRDGVYDIYSKKTEVISLRETKM